MQYYSTNHQSEPASFRQAIFNGLPSDNGLYMPGRIPQLPPSFFEGLSDFTLAEIGFEVLRHFVDGEIPDDDLSNIIRETLSFEIPLVEVSEDLYTLELFHGPTFAFKDVGARFLARCLGYFSEKTDTKLTVLVATSGDTGSAVAHGFFEVPNIDVVILYPTAKVSHFQEQQMATLGKNITALEIDGTFDDCQKLVKQAFLDDDLRKQKNLTSANSINIARLLPQSIYYFHALSQLSQEKRNQVIFSVPSGNYGNLSAGLIANKTGLPVKHFLACSNVNDTVPEYLQTTKYNPKPSIQTISNAMDVGDPSNFVRILDLHSGSHQQMKKNITGYSFSDDETRKAIRKAYKETGYILDPHGAVGYLGATDYLGQNAGIGIFLETAHPYKFRDVVEKETGKLLQPVVDFQNKEKQSIPFKNSFEDFKSFLLR
ncbi:MAG: threonine synthase [Balneolaceae bacterium]